MWTSHTSRPFRRTRLGSIFTTMHWLPNRRAASWTNSGSFTAAELIETLSHPASSSWRMSSSVRMPPPTVSGMNTCSAVRRTTSSMMSRPSWLAVMSRNTSSSAPSSSYRAATSTGIAGVAQVDEIRPLHHAPAVHVETGNHALGQHGAPALPAAPNGAAKLPRTEPSYAKLLSLGSQKGRVNWRP